MDNSDHEPPSPGLNDIHGTPVDDSSLKMDLNTEAASSSVVTLKPYSPSPVKHGRRCKYEIVPGVFVPNAYEKYITVDLDSTDVDIFEIHRDIKKCCGREPKISPQGNKRLIIETNSPEESQRLKNMASLGGVSVQCAPNFNLNHTRGMIYAPQLMIYSEEKLMKEFEDQGVVKVERMKKKIDGAIVPQPNLILTFNATRLPDIVFAAWLKLEVKLYVPRPKRCFHCQNFGHVVTSCRMKQFV